MKEYTPHRELWSTKVNGRTVKYELPVPPQNFNEAGEKIIGRLKKYLSSGVESKYKKEKIAFVERVFMEASLERHLETLKIRIDWYTTRTGPYRPEVSVYAAFNGGEPTAESYKFSPGYAVGSSSLVQALHHMFCHGDIAAMFAVHACRLAEAGTCDNHYYFNGWTDNVYDVVPKFDCSSGEEVFPLIMGCLGLKHVYSMSGEFFDGMDFSV